MKRHGWAVGCACLTALAAGCLETKQEYTINPDGSGKVVCEISIQDPSTMRADAPAQPPSEARAKATLRQILDQSAGIEAWKDVSCAWGDDKRLHFKGTGYFKNAAEVRLHPVVAGRMGLEKGADGGLVLELGGGKAAAAPAALTEEEIVKGIADQRAAYEQAKPTMLTVLGTMKMDFRFRLPGTVAEAVNFAKEGDGAVRLVVEGPKLMEAMDRLMADDAAMREITAAGESVRGGGATTSLVLAEKLLGRKALARVRTSGELKPLFDYAAEAGAAKAAEGAMRKRLGVDEAAPAAEKAPGGEAPAK